MRLSKKFLYATALMLSALVLQHGFAQQPAAPQCNIRTECSRTDVDMDDNGLIEICTLEELNAIRYQLDGSGYRESATASPQSNGCDAVGGCRGYELVNDLDFKDAGSYSSPRINNNWISGLGWQPIGSASNAFSSQFEGNGCTISNLYINSPSDERGLFARIAETAKIGGLRLAKVTISGGSKVGALAAVNEGIVNTMDVLGGSISGSGDDVGGLVGINEGIVIDNNVVLEKISGRTRVGGLVGLNKGVSATIRGSRAGGTVRGNESAGGLVGHNDELAQKEIYILLRYSS